MEQDHLDEEPFYPVKGLGEINLENYALQILGFYRTNGFLGCAYGFMDLPIVEKSKFLRGDMVG